MIVIGLSGKMGTGKTTLANMICDLVPGAERWSFGDAIRAEVAELLGIVDADVYHPESKKQVFSVGAHRWTGRKILQWWSTEIRRAADSLYWERCMDARLKREHVPSVVVIDDLRFLNELSTLRYGHKASVYRIDPYPGWMPGPHAQHITETALDEFEGFTGRFAPAFGELQAVAAKIVALEGLS